MNPPLQTSSFTREQPRISITTTTTSCCCCQYSHSRQQKAIACTSERAKQIIESREYHQPNQTNQSILSHRSGAHQPNVKEDLTVPLPNGCVCVRAPQRKSTPNQPHMANLKLPCGTRTQAAQQPEPISSKAPVKVSALSLSRELQEI